MAEEASPPPDPKVSFNHYCVYLNGQTVQVVDSLEEHTTKSLNLKEALLQQLDANSWAGKVCLIDKTSYASEDAEACAKALLAKIDEECETRKAAKVQTVKDALEAAAEAGDNGGTTPEHGGGAGQQEIIGEAKPVYASDGTLISPVSLLQPPPNDLDVLFVLTEMPEELYAASINPGIDGAFYLYGKDVEFVEEVDENAPAVINGEEPPAVDGAPAVDPPADGEEVPPKPTIWRKTLKYSPEAIEEEVSSLFGAIKLAGFNNWLRDLTFQTIDRCEMIFQYGENWQSQVPIEEGGNGEFEEKFPHGTVAGNVAAGGLGGSVAAVDGDGSTAEEYFLGDAIGAFLKKAYDINMLATKKIFPNMIPKKKGGDSTEADSTEEGDVAAEKIGEGDVEEGDKVPRVKSSFIEVPISLPESIHHVHPLLRDTNLYNKNMESVNPIKHDVGLVLHYLSDQLENSLKQYNKLSPEERDRLMKESLTEEEGDEVDEADDGRSSSKKGEKDPQMVVADLQGTTGVTNGVLCVAAHKDRKPVSTEDEQFLEDFLAGAYMNTLTEDDADVSKILDAQTLINNGQESCLVNADKEVPMISVLDSVSTKHLSERHFTPIQGFYKVILGKYFLRQFHSADSLKNSGGDYLGDAERSAKRNRIYPFFSEEQGWSILEIERLLLLEQFEELLREAQPERIYELYRTRPFHERIPKELLANVLHKALTDSDFLLNTRYFPRHDCVLVALHFRAIRGRSLWHRWQQNVVVSNSRSLFWNIRNKEQEYESLKQKEAELQLDIVNINNILNAPPVPAAGGKAPKGVPQPTPEEQAQLKKDKEADLKRKREQLARLSIRIQYTEADLRKMWSAMSTAKNFLAVDDRLFGNLMIREKCLVPADSSVILQGKFQRGTEGGDSTRCSAPGSVAEIDTIAPTQFETSLNRVLKDGLIFGVRTDERWAMFKEQLIFVLETFDALYMRKLTELSSEAGEGGEEGEQQPEFDLVSPSDYKLILNELKIKYDFGSFNCGFVTDQSRVCVSMDYSDLKCLPVKVMEKIYAEVKKFLAEKKKEFEETNDAEAVFDPIQVLEPDVFLKKYKQFLTLSNTQLPADFFAPPGEGEGGGEDGSNNHGSLPAIIPASSGDDQIDFIESLDLEKFTQDYSQVGTRFRYSMESSQVIEILSDGSCFCYSPLTNDYATKISHHGPASKASSQVACEPLQAIDDKSYKKNIAGTVGFYYEPGQPEDYEVSRRIFPDGTLIRVLLTGRVEVSFSDGTTSFRNPTLEELEKVEADSDWLGHLKNAYRAMMQLQPEELSTQQIESGLPGHWVISKLTDSTRTVRVDRKLMMSQFVVVPSVPNADGGEGGNIMVDGGEEGEEEGNNMANIQSLNIEELLERDYNCIQLSDKCEYRISNINVIEQIDPHNRDICTTASNGVLVVENEKRLQKRIICKDGTVITWKKMEDTGLERVIVEKPDIMPRVVAMHDKLSYTQNAKVDIITSDKSTFHIVPKTMNATGDLLPCAPDKRGSHCTVLFRHAPSKAVFRLNGLGAVDIFTKGDIEQTGEENLLAAVEKEGFYNCQLDFNKLELIDSQRNVFLMGGDQSLEMKLGTTISMDEDADTKKEEDPSCPDTMKEYLHPDVNFLPLPESCPPPRLFVIYSDGEAEEILEGKTVEDAFTEVEGDEKVVCIRDEPLSEPLLGCRSNTIFRVAESQKLDWFEPITLPNIIRGLSDSASAGASGAGGGDPITSAAAAMGSSVGSSTEVKFTTFRQFIEYPKISDSKKAEYVENKAGYERWEYEHSAVYQLLLAQEAERKAKEAKKKAKAKKPAKGKVEEPPPPPEEEKGPVHPMASLTAAELINKVIKYRNSEGKREKPSYATLVEGVKASIDEIKKERELEDKKVKLQQEQEELLIKQKENADRQREIEKQRAKIEKEISKKQPRCVTHVHVGINYKYFESQQGLKFLLETGQLDPDSRIIRKVKPGKDLPDLELTQKIKSVWNPRLVDEPPDEYIDTKELFENSHADFDRGYEGLADIVDPIMLATGGGNPNEPDGGQLNNIGGGQGGLDGNGAYGSPYSPNHVNAAYSVSEDVLSPDPPEDRRPSRPTTPVGPHPDKRGSCWDVYGNRRMTGKLISKAYISYNDHYLQVEGPTDRRTRTTSVINKKNSNEAPSVHQVRKNGAHLLTGDPRQTIPRSKDTMVQSMLKDEDLSKEVQWELTSSLQGLGDPNTLIEVIPGHVRFGLLRRGGVYQIVCVLRNLDVEGTRFNVKPPASEYVKIHYQPRQVPPGLSLTVNVELWAHHAAKIQQVIEVKCKAHVVKIPVSARVLEPDQYDKLDAESVLLNGKRILANNVRLHQDSDLKLKSNYIAPNDFQSLADKDEDEEVLMRAMRKKQIYGHLPGYGKQPEPDDEEEDPVKKMLMAERPSDTE